MFAYHKALASVYQDGPEAIIPVFFGGGIMIYYHLDLRNASPPI